MADNGAPPRNTSLIPLSTVVGVIGTLLITLLGFGVQQVNQLRADFDHDRLAARREYSSDLAELRSAMHKEFSNLRAEFREIVIREHDETANRFSDINSRIAEMIAAARDVNRAQDQLIERLRERDNPKEWPMP